jgi:hypothetical protein
MSLKESIMEELQRLRLDREKPPVKQVKERGKSKQSKQDKLLEEARQLLDSVEKEED